MDSTRPLSTLCQVGFNHTDSSIMAVDVQPRGLGTTATNMGARVREPAQGSGIRRLVAITLGKFAVVKLTPTELQQAHACPKLARPEARVQVRRWQVEQAPSAFTY